MNVSTAAARFPIASSKCSAAPPSTTGACVTVATGPGRRWRTTARRRCFINGWSGSGGDCFPYYFQKAGLGPLIGTRTWGGLIGMTGAPGLIDNGTVSVPTFGIYNTKGDWIIEG